MRPTPLRPAALAVLAASAIAVLLVGCGSSSGDDASEDPTATAATATSTETESEDATTTEADETTTTGAVTTTAASAGDEAICGPMEDLRDSDAEANKLVAGGDWPAIKAFYVDQTDDIVAIYDEAIALETEITAELETLRSVTVSAGDLAGSSANLMEFSTKLSAQPGLAESGAAALEANTFTKDTCGFPLAGF